MIMNVAILIMPVLFVAAWLLAIAAPSTWYSRATPFVEDRMLIAAGSVGLALWFVVWLLGKVAPSASTPRIITLVSLTAFAGAFVVAAIAWRRVGFARERRAFWWVAIPALLLLAASSLTATGLGILWSGPGTIVEIQSQRYLAMPGDNLIPNFFAAGLRNANIPVPLMGDWYSADRPPLQTGLLLLFSKALEKTIRLSIYNGDGYIAIVCQSFFSIAVFRFARTIARSRAVGAVAAAAAILVPATGIYVFYPWPKLLAAAFLLTAFSLTLDLLRSERQPNQYVITIGILWGVCISLALLSHGGSLFGVIPLAVIFFVACLRRCEPARTSLRVLSASVIAAIATYLPWTIYGKVTGEDHGRLIKWHFAGNSTPSTTPSVDVLREAYARLTFDDWLSIKRANFVALYRKPDSPTTLRQLIEQFQDTPRWRVLDYQILMYACAPALLWILLLLVLLLTPRRSRIFPLLRPLAIVLVWLAVTIMVWCLMMFLPGSTVPHQGPIITIFLPTIVFAMIVTTLSYRFGLVMLAVQFVLFAYVMIPPNSIRFDSLSREFHPSPVAIALALVGVACGIAALIVARWSDSAPRIRTT